MNLDEAITQFKEDAIKVLNDNVNQSLDNDFREDEINI